MIKKEVSNSRLQQYDGNRIAFDEPALYNCNINKQKGCQEKGDI